MHIIAIGWIYVVFMMAITEKSVIAGVMTFMLYCAAPLGVIWFILNRRRKHYVDIKKAERNNLDLHNAKPNVTTTADQTNDTGNSNDNFDSKK